MPSVGYFLDLLNAVSRRDFEEVLAIGRALADDERDKGHFNVAHQILRAVEIASSQRGFDQIGTFSSPVTQATALTPEGLYFDGDLDFGEPVLDQAAAREVEGFLHEWHFEERLRARNLSPRHRVLIYGAPGTGKTLLARTLARTLKMPLYFVRFDSLMSSFLGETGSKIKSIFDFIAQNRCALFIDEIDAIAKLRDDRNELGELKRIVISLLQNFDLVSTRSLLIGATNHPHMLDPALWRRFELVIELKVPGGLERKHILERYLDFKLSDTLSTSLANCTDGLTGSDLREIAISSHRKHLLDEDTKLEEALFLSVLEYIVRGRGVAEDSPDRSDRRILTAACYLRFFGGKKRYTFQRLQSLTGIPHSTLHHRFSSECKALK